MLIVFQGLVDSPSYGYFNFQSNYLHSNELALSPTAPRGNIFKFLPKLVNNPIWIKLAKGMIVAFERGL